MWGNHKYLSCPARPGINNTVIPGLTRDLMIILPKDSRLRGNDSPLKIPTFSLPPNWRIRGIEILADFSFGVFQNLTTDHPHSKSQPSNSQKVFIKSFGCQMNVYDSQRMADGLAAHGYSEVSAAEDADLVILNTCHIREKADDKLFSDLGRFREIKEARLSEGKQSVLAVAGCVAQAQGAEIMTRQSAVDLVFGPQTYHQLPELVARTKNNLRAPASARVVATDFLTHEKFDALTAPLQEQTRQRGVSAFVTIQEGCDKFCTFCVVPYTRGAEFSRPLSAIIDEVQTLVAQGVREVTLLGQNVNAWNGLDAQGKPSRLSNLIFALADLIDLKRIRYTTSHPNDMSADLLAAHKDCTKLMPFLHLPVQSGSDKILHAMNRRHKAEDYLSIIDDLRALCPDIALSSDFIVGFPGETEEDFCATLALIEKVNFASCFYFKYSARPGTPAADLELEHGVPEDVKSERLARLKELVEGQRQAYQKSLVGRTVEILVERPGRYDGQLIGKTPWLQPVHFSGSASLIGTLVPVRLQEAHTNSFVGVFSEAFHSPII